MSTRSVSQIEQEYFELVEKADGILNQAKSDRRDLSPNEKSDVKTITDKLETLDAERTVAKAKESSSMANARAKGEQLFSDRMGTYSHREGDPIVLTATQGLQLSQDHRDLPPHAFGEFCKARVAGVNSKTHRSIRNAMSTSDNTAGGFMVPDVLSDLVIDKARAKSQLLAAGASIQLMNSESQTWAKVTGDPTFETKAENAAFTSTSITFGAVTANSQTIGCFIECSRELVEDGQNFPQLLESVLVRAIGAQLDKYGLQGTGSAQPMGLINHPDISATGSVGAIAWADLSTAATAVRNANYEPTGYILNPSIDEDLALLADSQTRWLGAPENVANLSRFSTTNMVATSMVLGDFSQVFWCIRRGALVEASAVSGDAFKKHQVHFKIVFRGDFVCANPAAFHILNGITT